MVAEEVLHRIVSVDYTLKETVFVLLSPQVSVVEAEAYLDLCLKQQKLGEQVHLAKVVVVEAQRRRVMET